MTTITTGPDGEALFDGTSVQELIAWHEEYAAALNRLGDPDNARGPLITAAALRHLSAQPDPLTVTGRLRWEDDRLYLGTREMGRVTQARRSNQWVASLPEREIARGLYEDARDALVEAVKEAIGG